MTVLALGLLLSVLGLPNAGPAAAADAPAEQRFVDLINAERRTRGLATVALRPEVTPVARAWTAAMIAAGALSHNPLVAGQMPADWVQLGENVGVGAGVDSLHTAFMNSPAHRANVLGDFNQVGVGVDGDVTGRMWVTVNFLKSRVQAGAPVAVPAPAAGP
ncbi:MAG: CAP domain-containing protein, partial [Actinomycetota bacterium]|nr:CAP domain-containing protein [Actinomycetota bacterium]